MVRGWPDHRQKKEANQLFNKQTRPPLFLFRYFKVQSTLAITKLLFHGVISFISKLSVQRENAWTGLLIRRKWLRLVGIIAVSTYHNALAPPCRRRQEKGVADQVFLDISRQRRV